VNCEFGWGILGEKVDGTDLPEEFKALMSGAFSICNE
jgi:hypothetical protein